MGGKHVKPVPKGAMVEIMTRKYGDQSIEFLKNWDKKYGFPLDGSFSSVKIQKLKMDLEAKEKKMKNRKTVKVKDLDKMEKNKCCLEQWEEEGKLRERKQLQKQLTLVQVSKKEKSKEKIDPNRELSPHNPFSALSLYPSLTGAAGPLLETCNVPPPYQAAEIQGNAVIQQPQPLAPGPLLLTGPETRQQHREITFAEQQNAFQRQNPNTPPQELPSTSTPSATSWASPRTWTQALRELSPRGYFNSPATAPTTDPTEQLDFTFPMIQVPGPDGAPQLVFRPWTDADIRTAMSHLPKISSSGIAFSTAFQVFCEQFMPTGQEMHRLLMLQVGPVLFSKISRFVTGGQANVRPRRAGWDHADNQDYRNFVTAVCAGISAQFPERVDMSIINSTKQRTDESVEEYHQKMLTTFQAHGGIPKPEDVALMTVWETHLKNAFINGLLPDIKRATERSVIGLEDARHEEVVKHAKHNQKQLREGEISQDRKYKQVAEKAQLSMLQAVSNLTMYQDGAGNRQNNNNWRSQSQGRGYGKGRGRGTFSNNGAKRQTGYDECFECGQKGHWARDCPNQSEKKGGWTHDHKGNDRQAKNQFSSD